MPAIYALLVGINQYPGNPLQGCINDVKAVEQYLRTVCAGNKDLELSLKILTDESAEKPDRQNIINAFRFFEPAGKEDTCFFYYSGHGSFAQAPEVLESDNGFVQSFVCSDSRMPGGRDLMNKEMSFLIWQTMFHKPDTVFVAITDCCHSGTITKAFLDADSKVTDRMTPPKNATPDPVENYLGYAVTLDGVAAYETNAAGKLRSRQGKHIHLAASRDSQTSKELRIDGMVRGAFTHSLLKTLYNHGGNISYRELMDKTASLVGALVRDQQPGLNTNGGLPATERNNIFLSRQAAAFNPRYLLYKDAQYGWCIDGGTAHGIHKGDRVIINESLSSTVLATPRADCAQLFNKPGFAAITEPVYVQVVRQPQQLLPLSFDAAIDPTVKHLVATALENYQPDAFTLPAGQPGRFIIRSNARQEAMLSLPGSEAALFKPIPLHNSDDAATFLVQVDKLCNWTRLRELVQPPPSPGLYTIKLYQDTTGGNYDPATFEALTGPLSELHELLYKQYGEKWYQPAIRLSITNNGARPLWVTNAYLGFDYSINSGFFEPLEIAPGNTAWLQFVSRGMATDVIKMRIDQTFQELGYTAIYEYIKLFLSLQDPVKTDHLQQKGLSLTAAEDPKPTALERGVGPEEEEDTGYTWACETLGFHITKPASIQHIIPGQPTRLQSFTLAAHSSFEGKVTLHSSGHSSVAGSSKSFATAGNAAYNYNLQPFNLAAGLRSDNATDMLEFFGVRDAAVVTEAAPLTLQAQSLRDAGPVLPLGFDPETGLYYPLGFSNASGDIIITRLPAESAVNSDLTEKSLTGSIKIYFRKVLNNLLGLPYSYPRLAAATVTAQGIVRYQTDKTLLRQAVAKASHITLFVHGIIGDTEGMVQCINLADEHTGKTIAQNTDLVLTFDYENLNTQLEETAVLLKDALAEIGIGTGSGKMLTVVAHSMGGLVSRLFIEQHGGHQVVSRLIMLGTPNAGTPWADVRDLAEVLLTLALNGASLLQPWLLALAGVGKLAGGLQNTLKEMDSETGIYTRLNTGTYPGIPYFIVAGNTQLVGPAYQATDNAVQKLFRRLKSRAVYDLLDTALFKKPNDIAVTNTSITRFGQSNDWATSPQMLTVACDHLSYFGHPEAVSFVLNNLR